jgi:hypothetical protein
MGTREYEGPQRQLTASRHHQQLSWPSTTTKSPTTPPDSPEAAAEAAPSEGTRELSKAAGGHRTGRSEISKIRKKSEKIEKFSRFQ